MQPFSLYEGKVEPEWVDANNHMNDGYYPVAFGIATWAVQDHLGMDPEYRARTAGTLYTVEGHVTYARELVLGQAIHVQSLLIGVDTKRVRVFHRMYATEAGYLAATMDVMMLHVDMNTVKTMPIPDDLLSHLRKIAHAHAARTRVPDVGDPD